MISIPENILKTYYTDGFGMQYYIHIRNIFLDERVNILQISL